MDPAIEVATLVVSYLWALRDLFPEHSRVSDFSSTLSEETLPSRIVAPTEYGKKIDFALVARLQNIARRLPEQRWKTEEEDPNETVDFDEVVFRESDTRLGSDARRASVGERLKYRAGYVSRMLFNVRVTDADQERAAKVCLSGFVRHATFIVDTFAGVDEFKDRLLREVQGRVPGASAMVVSREGLTDDIALWLVQADRLQTFAEKLEYRPVLLQGLDGAGNLPELLSGREYPRALIKRCETEEQALPFSLVLHKEIDEIEQSRQLRLQQKVPDYSATLATRRAYEQGLLGLALSGGGIRSATLSLGILQGLSNRGWLPHIDYLSTVSGGGYIGAWLVAWIKRRGSVQAVQESLRGYKLDSNGYASLAARNADPGAEHVRPIRLLREFSNYLTPNPSVFSTDTWTMISIWLRNTALNLLTLTLFLMAVLIAPQVLGLLFIGWNVQSSVTSAVGCLLVAAFLVGLNLRSFDDATIHVPSRGYWKNLLRIPAKGSERGDTSLMIIATIVLPALAAAFFAVRALWSFDPAEERRVNVLLYTFVPLSVGIAVTIFAGRPLFAAPPGQRPYQMRATDRLLFNTQGHLRSLASGIVAAAAGSLLVMAIHQNFLPILHSDSRRGAWIALALGPAGALMVLGVVIVLYLGLEGRRASDEHREWWSRLGAWLALIGTAWSSLALMSFLAPYAVATAGIYAGTLGIGWSAFIGLGAWLASSGQSNGLNLPLDKKFSSWLIISVAPYLFIAGFLVAVAVLGHASLYLLQERPLPFSLSRYVETYWAFLDPASLLPLFVLGALLFGSACLAARVDVNEFSMHNFYKNRLVRAFLGASRSRSHRRPNAFTGFDMNDDIKLWRFRHDDPPLPNDVSSDCRAGFRGPFPVVNATLNLTSGDELAWQERKGQSFTFTPIYSGYDFATKQTASGEKVSAQFGHRPTRTFGNGVGEPNADSGLGIGTAIAISGAAANPNAGYHTSPAVAFMLTLFNARLGWWMGNPRLEKWKRQSPRFGLAYLTSELFGFSGVHRGYVNLSDGGHFDNMGLYELIRRHCRYIIVCDGEQDDRYSFNGLAGAIRKCRIDFGVIIDLPVREIEPEKPGENSRKHAVVGTITYPGQQPGSIVYIKASFTGDEPTDVREYRHRHAEFPHQTTGDQFFDESQFESYRALGQHIADKIFPDWDETQQTQPLEQIKDLIKKASCRCEEKSSATLKVPA